MQFFTNLLVVVSLVLSVVSSPVLENDNSLVARNPADIEARVLDDSLIRRLPKGSVDERAEDEEEMERRAANTTSAFSTLKQQLRIVSSAGVTLQSSIFELSSTPTFDQIMNVYAHLDTFVTSSRAVYKSMKSVKPITSTSEATSAVAIVKPLIGSVSVAVQGLVAKKDVFNNLGIGCIIEFLLALILAILLALLEILISILFCNQICVKDLQDLQTSTQTTIKAAIAAFKN